MSDHHIVRVEPAGIDVEVRAGEALMAATERAGYRWPTVCGGFASCRVCCLRVMAGTGNLVEPEGREREALDELAKSGRDIRDLRLACQLRVRGSAVVEKRGVRLAGPADRKPAPVQR